MQISEDLPANTIRVSDSLLRAKAIHKQAPEFPAAARAEKLTGTVYVKIIIDETGTVTKSELVCGPDLLAVAALEAARKWRFSPALLHDKPVKVQCLLAFSFSR